MLTVGAKPVTKESWSMINGKRGQQFLYVGPTK